MGHTRGIGQRRSAGSSAWLRAGVVGILLLGACATAESTAEPTESTADPTESAAEPTVSAAEPPGSAGAATGLGTDGTWILTEATVDGTSLALDGEGTVTLNVQENGLFGQAACNGYGADYDVDGDTLTIEFGGMTAMGCGEALEALEDAYLGALERVDSFERASDDQLVLAGDGVELVFVVEAPVDLAGMVGATWTLVELRDGDTTIVPGGDGFVRFDEGTMTGSTGCRDLDGTWTAQGSSIAFSNLGADGECPGQLQEQDRFVTGIFENMTATVTGDQLVLSSRQGGRSLVYDRN